MSLRNIKPLQGTITKIRLSLSNKRTALFSWKHRSSGKCLVIPILPTSSSLNPPSGTQDELIWALRSFYFAVWQIVVFFTQIKCAMRRSEEENSHLCAFNKNPFLLAILALTLVWCGHKQSCLARGIKSSVPTSGPPHHTLPRKEAPLVNQGTSVWKRPRFFMNRWTVRVTPVRGTR